MNSWKKITDIYFYKGHNIVYNMIRYNDKDAIYVSANNRDDYLRVENVNILCKFIN